MVIDSMSISIEKKWMKREKRKMKIPGGGGGGDAEYPSKMKMSGRAPPKRRQEEIVANGGPTVYAS